RSCLFGFRLGLGSLRAAPARDRRALAFADRRWMPIRKSCRRRRIRRADQRGIRHRARRPRDLPLAAQTIAETALGRDLAVAEDARAIREPSPSARAFQALDEPRR